jgi:hypothetical protein
MGPWDQGRVKNLLMKNMFGYGALLILRNPKVKVVRNDSIRAKKVTNVSGRWVPTMESLAGQTDRDPDVPGGFIIHIPNRDTDAEAACVLVHETFHASIADGSMLGEEMMALLTEASFELTSGHDTRAFGLKTGILKKRGDCEIEVNIEDLERREEVVKPGGSSHFLGGPIYGGGVPVPQEGWK